MVAMVLVVALGIPQGDILQVSGNGKPYSVSLYGKLVQVLGSSPVMKVHYGEQLEAFIGLRAGGLPEEGMQYKQPFSLIISYILSMQQLILRANRESVRDGLWVTHFIVDYWSTNSKSSWLLSKTGTEGDLRLVGIVTSPVKQDNSLCRLTPVRGQSSLGDSLNRVARWFIARFTVSLIHNPRPCLMSSKGELLPRGCRPKGSIGVQNWKVLPVHKGHHRVKVSIGMNRSPRFIVALEGVTLCVFLSIWKLLMLGS